MARAPSHAPALDDALGAGLCGSAVLTVTAGDTAAEVGSGDVPVLATPRLVALCEEASCRAIGGRLGPDRTSVASRVQFDHLVPVPIGATVEAEATLEKVEGRRLVFTVAATVRAAGLVAAGRLTRVVVDRSAFLAKAGCPDAAGSTPCAPGGTASG